MCGARCNGSTEIRGTDGGIWSRPKLIPFTVSFRGREDRGLKNALLGPAELSGVLRWAVEGCQEYLESGLAYPDEVVQATEDDKADSNIVARFVDECCAQGDTFRARARPLYQEFSKWAESSDGITEKAFGTRLKALGFPSKHTNTGNVYLGIARMNAKEGEE